MKKMIIGVAASFNKTQFVINKAYVDYVNACEGLSALLIMPGANIPDVVAACDGILMPGGIDLDPLYYGEDNYSSYIVDPKKDEFEREIFHTARSANKPIFGICRGFQLIASEYMAFSEPASRIIEFRQHIPGHQQTEALKLDRGICSHQVKCRHQYMYWDGGEIDPTLPQTTQIGVNSMHHQGIVIPGNISTIDGLYPLAASVKGLTVEDSGSVICEAFRIVNWGAPILAVQWHPEELKDVALLENFFKSAGGKFPKVPLLKPKDKQESGNYAIQG